ncbi:MAG: hypothetical protein COU98_00380 [Candidatus Staskawiczbacteria bacterium CG10_big_fil_rev_8_21_14_0_10_38_10]|uniref:Fibronectin type-III domain-containing protein n=1 Tax=Candidatus Staskawiczbacteria bacterium CG10_big_fil_rev_8_21_14_0_10_38_10 TaxID=1974891 RepID=A0A2H9T1Y7_9BACT|nr:MAG: hypothetical protein COU98_00380 [Candidatus Staskawiczbacteria bacterium CG10_big_fil_rev_8_21_14_0_10_38_10]
MAVLWQTDELATSQVEYGLTDAYGTETTEDTTLTIQHGEEITGLTTNTTYHFRVKSKDSSNNPTTSSDYTFSTQVTATTTIIRRVIDPDAPIISNIQVKEIKQDSAKISWTTSEDANTLVAYGQTSQYGLLAGDISAATSNHNVALTNLTQGTTYHYKIYAYDSSGNKGYSDEKTFKTLKEGEVAPPTEEEVPAEEEVTPTEEEEQRSILERIKTASRGFFARIWETLPLNPNLLGISETIFVGSVSEMASRVITPPVIIAGFPRVEELEPTRVKVVWVTDKESNSILTLASDVDYDPTKDQPYPIIMGNPDEEVLNHEVQIIGLEAQTLYHYEVRSRSKYGEWAKSGDRIFTTLSMTAEIFDIKFMEIAEESVKLTWKTTIPTRSNFEITDLSTGEKAAQEDPSYLKDHEFVITSLTASTNYTVQIFADDEIGNRSSSPVLPFTTTLSLEPPEISQVRIITSIIPGKVEKIQAIISWKTDKPATSKIYYEEGITTHKDLVLTTPLDKELVKDHTVITTAFKPGKAYRLRIESTDASGNASYSKDYTILTPRPRESILDLIIKNFEEIFGFLRQMKF